MDANISDEALIRFIVRRDPAALEALFDRYGQIAYNLIVCIVREPAVADEVLQETFWTVWQQADKFRGKGTVAAWIYRIARNNSVDELRRRMVQAGLVNNKTKEANNVNI